ncbi:MAG: hydrogenase 3 maturation endopeptidase HyCI [Candidatus Omnitrophota bacterium]
MTIRENESSRRKITSTLSRIFKSKTVIVGVGNVLRGDDAFGPALVERLKGSVKDVCIDAGSAPENYLGKIAKEKPDAVIIVDAAHLGQPAGGYDLLKKADIARSGFTTHDLSPAMFIEYLEKETGADIYMLAVQPENLSFGDEMSDSVKRTLEELAALIEEAHDA